MLVATLVALLLPGLASASENIFSDSFDGNDVRDAGAIPGFWTVIQSPDDQKSEASKRKGRLQLLAADQAYASVSVISQKTDKFGFFARPITITLDDIQLEAKGIPEGEARFKLSVASAQVAAEKAENVISIRIRSGLLLLGYRIDGFNLLSPPETLSGQRINPVAAIPLKGVPTKVSLTLGPAPKDGFIRYEIFVLEDGNPAVTRSGSIPLTIGQWGGSDDASIVIAARRDSATSLTETQTEFSVGQITVTR